MEIKTRAIRQLFPVVSQPTEKVIFLLFDLFINY